MRNNQPVTQNKINIPENAILTSSTDMYGNITAATKDFIEVSGFSREELLGSPHNMVRHPDVPEVIFKDLWQTLQAGGTWRAPVKNRSKNGDYYWVEANVSQIRENGKLIGYISVRRQMTDFEISQAEVLYTKIANGQMVIKQGLVTPKLSFTKGINDWFKNLKIATRLVLGFGVLLVGFGASTLFIETSLKNIEVDSKRIAELRVPTSAASSQMVNNINASLASLRGWMLTGNESFKLERSVVWKDIEKTVKLMDEFSQNWTNPENVAKWAEFKTILKEFKTAQQQVESIANTPAEQPATQILVNEAAPLASGIIKNITKMINLEAQAEVSEVRKALLISMANFRGSMGLSLANIRANLLTGDVKFTEVFNQFWATNQRSLKEIQASKYLLDDAQLSAFTELESLHAKFTPLPPKMFKTRNSQKWNMANYTLVTEAAPRAGKLLTILAGPKNANDERTGGMVANQRGLLNNDAIQASETISMLQYLVLLMLVVGLIVSSLVALLIIRSIVRPVKELHKVLDEVAMSSDFSKRVSIQSKDEIGEAGLAFNAMMMEAQYSIAMVNESLQGISAGDCTRMIRLDLNGDLKRLKEGANGTATSISGTMRELRKALEAIHDGKFSVEMHAELEGQYKVMLDLAVNSMATLNATVSGISDVMSSMQQGEFGERIDVEAKGDLLTVKEMVNDSMATLEKAVGDIVQVASAQAKGDLTQTIGGEYQGQLQIIKNSMNATGHKLDTVISELNLASHGIADNSREVASSTMGLSDRIQGQAATLEETSASMSEMTSTLNQTSESAQEANLLAEQARAESNNGSAVMQKAIASMEKISESSSKIADIITLMDGIAFQTNLLALNAAVEAARAGEAGRGFAVVAGEVRQLAQKSAEASKDIKVLIEDSVIKVEEGTVHVSSTGEALVGINASIEKVEKIVSHIMKSSQNQQIGIEQVNHAVMDMNLATQENAALVEETSSASDHMNGLSGDMLEKMDFFKTSQGR